MFFCCGCLEVEKRARPCLYGAVVNQMVRGEKKKKTPADLQWWRLRKGTEKKTGKQDKAREKKKGREGKGRNEGEGRKGGGEEDKQI